MTTLGAPEPEILLRLGESRHLYVMLQAQRGAPARRREAAGHPGVVAERLVVQRSRFERRSVPLAKCLLPVHDPVAQPPRGGVGDRSQATSDPEPVVVTEALRHGESPRCHVSARQFHAPGQYASLHNLASPEPRSLSRLGWFPRPAYRLPVISLRSQGLLTGEVSHPRRPRSNPDADSRPPACWST